MPGQQQPPPRVAVIGAGPLGLMGLKNLKEDGFDVTSFESRPYIGGIWQYSEDAGLSVADSTIFNSSRFRSAISDFPFPDETDDFPTWQQMSAYLESYCDHFGLREHIRLGSRVTQMVWERGRWKLLIKAEGKERAEWFDKVMVATGTWISPKSPRFDGIELFGGPHVHAMNFHKPHQYKGKNVLLIGLHATTQDVANSLAGYASKVYASHRHGVVMVPRYTPTHAVFDAGQSLRLLFFQFALSKHFPHVYNTIFDFLVGRMSRAAYPNIPASWNFSPSPSAAIHPPLIADEMWALLQSGFAEPVAAVERILGPREVRLVDGRVLDDVDAIVYCTGYETSVPIVTKGYDPYPVAGGPPNMYRGIFPLHEDPELRNSLAYLGHGAIPFPGFVQYEMAAMAASQIWQGKVQLPDYREMKEWHTKTQEWRKDIHSRERFLSALPAIHVPTSDFFYWLDNVAGTGIAEHFGWLSWKAWSFWWKDWALYNRCLNGLMSPAIWRLFETGRRKTWSGARDQIFKDEAILAERIRRRKGLVEGADKLKSSTNQP